ncbi:hypothetical protein [Phyllobacterium sp. 22552]|uniref:hypothetical protein n=1 Tax=Phyllobacterium sp. 22552 TaxID=3453941 RepID=UPI003F87AF68
MSLSVRYFLFPEGSEPLRLSQRLIDGLVRGTDALPQFANSSQKVMDVLLENVDGKAVEIHSASGSIWAFDKAGVVSAHLREAMAAFMDVASQRTATSSTVVALQPRLDKKRVEEKYRWKPTRVHIDRVAKDIWPKVKGDRLKDAKGVAGRRPPLTYDAKNAIEKASAEFWKIANEIEDLKPPSLKGFLYEVRQRFSNDPDYRHLYEALAKMGEDQLELLKRRESGNGVWYAVVEVWRSTGAHSSDVIQVFHRRCEDRQKAVIATRELLAKHAGLFDDGITLEASVMTDTEWKSHPHAK